MSSGDVEEPSKEIEHFVDAVDRRLDHYFFLLSWDSASHRDGELPYILTILKYSKG